MDFVYFDLHGEVYQCQNCGPVTGRKDRMTNALHTPLVRRSVSWGDGRAGNGCEVSPIRRTGSSV